MEVLTEAHLAIDVDVGGLSSLFPYDADAANACRSRLAFDGCALFCTTTTAYHSYGAFD